MRKTKFDDSPYGSLKRGLIFGFLTGAAVVLLLSVILAFIMTSRDISDGLARVAATVILSVGCFASGFTAARVNSSRGLIVGIADAAVIFTAVTVIGIISGGFTFSALTVIRFFAVTASSVIGGVAGVNVRRKSSLKLS